MLGHIRNLLKAQHGELSATYTCAMRFQVCVQLVGSFFLRRFDVTTVPSKLRGRVLRHNVEYAMVCYPYCATGLKLADSAAENGHLDVVQDLRAHGIHCTADGDRKSTRLNSSH